MGRCSWWCRLSNHASSRLCVASTAVPASGCGGRGASQTPAPVSLLLATASPSMLPIQDILSLLLNGW